MERSEEESSNPVRVKAPGLVWIPRARGHTPYWRAGSKDFKPYHVNLARLVNKTDELISACEQLQAEYHQWVADMSKAPQGFDGTIADLIRRYKTDEDSPFLSLKPSSHRLYRTYLPKIEQDVGGRRIDAVAGVDVKRWYGIWSQRGKHLAAAAAQLAILKAVVAYGIMCRFDGCSQFAEVLRETGRRLPHPRRREAVATYDQVVAARIAAHEADRPSWALAYAMVYETTLRLWDVIGQWVPLDSPGISDVINERRKEKWLGLKWEDIGDDLILRYTPSKTEQKTGKRIVYPLTFAPMVMEEIQHCGDRAGPMILDPDTGQPPRSDKFWRGWCADRNAAGLPTSLWARDLRASGITEARAGAVSLDDAASVAGHAGKRTTGSVYDRAALEAAERFAKARLSGRK